MLLGSLQGIFYPYYRGMVNYVKRKIMFLLYIGKETCRWICSLWQWMVHNLGINAWVLFIELLWGTRIKIIPRIYTTAEKLSKINNVAPPGRLGKHKTKQTKNPWVFWADITDMFGMDLVMQKHKREQIYWICQAQGENSGLLSRLPNPPRQIFCFFWAYLTALQSSLASEKKVYFRASDSLSLWLRLPKCQTILHNIQWFFSLFSLQIDLNLD